jgi:hypothetical protein
MADSDSDRTTGGDDDSELDRQDPLVERLRPDPAVPPPKVITLAGLLGDSERPGYKRLYFSTALDYYAEVRNEDILHIVSIEPPLPPFVGLDATRLTIDRGAMIDYVRSALADEFDDFDIDIQIGPASGAYGVHPLTYSQVNCGTGVGCQGTIGGCPSPTQPVTQCAAYTCQTCQTCQTKCNQYTCNTCNTQCGQNTCHTCNEQTCHTCNTQCGQNTCWNTCQTCATQCGVDCALNNPTAPANCVPTPGQTRPPCLTADCA